MFPHVGGGVELRLSTSEIMLREKDKSAGVGSARRREILYLMHTQSVYDTIPIMLYAVTGMDFTPTLGAASAHPPALPPVSGSMLAIIAVLVVLGSIALTIKRWMPEWLCAVIIVSTMVLLPVVTITSARKAPTVLTPTTAATMIVDSTDRDYIHDVLIGRLSHAGWEPMCGNSAAAPSLLCDGADLRTPVTLKRSQSPLGETRVVHVSMDGKAFVSDNISSVDMGYKRGEKPNMVIHQGSEFQATFTIEAAS